MTDEQMDVRLRRAGETWRAAEAGMAAVHAPAEDHSIAERVQRPRRSHRVGLLASAAVVVAALVAGGAFLISDLGGGKRTDKAADAAALEGTVWRLVALDHRRVQANSTSTLHIGRDGSLVADDDCAVLGGKARVDGAHISVPDLAVRTRSCTDTSQPTFVGAGAAVLKSGGTFELDGDRLTITGATATMHLVADADLTPPSLDVPTFVGVEWRLTEVRDGDGINHVVRGKPRLTIDDDGRLLASDGCNTMSGQVTVDGGRLRTNGGLAVTEIGCEPDVIATAAVVDAVLADGADQSVVGAALTITSPGAGSLTYQWVPADAAAMAPSSLVFRTWTLKSIAGVPVRGRIVLYASPAEASVTFGCGAVGGNAQVGTGTLRITGNVEGPAVGCTGAVGDESTTVGSFLNQKPALWSVRGNKLLIYGGGAQAFSLVFETATPSPTVSSSTAADTAILTGRKWTFAGMEASGPGGVSGQGTGWEDAPVVFTVDDKGGFRLASRCGALTGRAVIAGRHITFSDKHAVAGSCVLGMAMTAADELDGTLAWKIDNGTLRLTNSGLTLVFWG